MSSPPAAGRKRGPRRASWLPVVASWRDPSTRRLVVAGVVLWLALASTAAVDPAIEARRWLGLTAAAAVAYGVVLWTLHRATPRARAGLGLCLLMALVGRVPLLLGPPTLSDDIYRYLWDGRLQHAGHDPYGSAPDAPELASLHTPVTRLTNNPDLPTIYPPGAQWFFWVVTAAHESVLAMKLAFVLCEVVVVGMLVSWLGARGRSAWWVLAYAWNPLVVLEVAGSGHLDVLGALLLVASAAALARGRGLTATLTFAGAVTVKFLPVVLLPLYWRRVRAWHLAAGVALGALLYSPYLGQDLQPPTGSLAYYLEKWRFNAPLYLAAERWLAAGERAAADSDLPAAQPVLLAAPLGLGLLAAAWARRRRPSADPAAWSWPLGVTLVTMPAVYPWYLLWIAPFLDERSTIPLAVWTVSILLTYAVLAIAGGGGVWAVPPGVSAAEYGLPVAAMVWLAASRPPQR